MLEVQLSDVQGDKERLESELATAASAAQASVSDAKVRDLEAQVEELRVAVQAEKDGLGRAAQSWLEEKSVS